ncbi:MAG: hypothetical protein GY927_06395 [bacterium]|nr:hypothetical protein [bacterium]
MDIHPDIRALIKRLEGKIARLEQEKPSFIVGSIWTVTPARSRHQAMA